MTLNMFRKAFSKQLVLPLLSSVRGHVAPTLQCMPSRSICDRALLRLDEHDREKKRMQAKVKDMDSFWLRMFSLQDSGLAFEDDLKLAWVLAEKDHLPYLIDMTQRFTTKCSQGSFGSFRFGSVMMRTCHSLNCPDTALNISKNEILQKWLTDPISNIVLMDLLIENGKFSDAANVYEQLEKTEWFFALRNPLIPMMYAISLYKIGSTDAFEKAHKLTSKPLMKLVYIQKVEDIVAAFALQVKQPSIAYQLIRKRETSSEISWNIMIQTIVMQTQHKDTILRKLQQKGNFGLYKDTLAAVRATYPDLAKTLNITPIDLTVEEQVLGTIYVQDKKHVTPQRKRYY